LFRKRRNQKVIEETGPNLSDAVRTVARNWFGWQAVGYRSAGTVEFVFDAHR
jgi:acetyl/propionyl-CoA carboxylase alpha subunit